MQLRVTSETLVNLACYSVLVLGLAGGVWIASAPMPGGAGEWAIGTGRIVACASVQDCAARGSLGLPVDRTEER